MTFTAPLRSSLIVATALACVLTSFDAHAEEAVAATQATPPLPTIAFSVRDLNDRDVDATILVDNASIPLPIGRLVSLEPGMHLVHWFAVDGRRGTQRVTAVEGQYGRAVTLVAVPFDDPKVSAPREQSAPIWPWVLIGGGTALLLTGGMLQILAHTEDLHSRELHARADDATSAQETNDLRAGASSYRDAAETNQALAITSACLGLTALAVGITWAIVGTRAPDKPRALITPLTATF